MEILEAWKDKRRIETNRTRKEIIKKYNLNVMH